jgi:hypothetical protein
VIRAKAKDPHDSNHHILFKKGVDLLDVFSVPFSKVGYLKEGMG